MIPRAHRTIAEEREIADDASDFVEALLKGLTSEPKRIPCKFFYDAEGSRLFEKICALPEYYPTRIELALLRRHAEQIAALIGPRCEIMEFGAGAGEKIRPLLNALDRACAYFPIDISGPYLQSVAGEIQAKYPALAVHPIVADFTASVSLPGMKGARRVGFFPGSTIGNFEPEAARRFLKQAARVLKGGGLLIGVDLVKDPAVLHAAYNDRSGVTEAFNKNLLVRANREAGANFDLARFAHYAFYNPLQRRIEMYLVSTAAQRVGVCGRAIPFREGEAIHTENSHKYTLEDFRALAASAGFVPRAMWCDEDRFFSIHWLESP